MYYFTRTGLLHWFNEFINLLFRNDYGLFLGFLESTFVDCHQS